MVGIQWPSKETGLAQNHRIIISNLLFFCGYHATYVAIQQKFRTSLEPSLVGQPLHYLEPSWAMKIATYSVTDVYAIFP